MLSGFYNILSVIPITYFIYRQLAYLKILSSREGGCSKRVFTEVALVRNLETIFRICSPRTCSRSGPRMEKTDSAIDGVSLFFCPSWEENDPQLCNEPFVPADMIDERRDEWALNCWFRKLRNLPQYVYIYV